jgi:hypothetical protein
MPLRLVCGRRKWMRAFQPVALLPQVKKRMAELRGLDLPGALGDLQVFSFGIQQT